MLINFTISNFRSIGREASFSMVASSLADLPENTIPTERLKLLSSGVIYGPNSAGKSNLFEALDVMKYLVLNSQKFTPDEKLHYDPFQYISGMDKEPTVFEIVLLIDDTKYRYGFAYNEKEILEEWLFSATKEAEKNLFKRVGDEISTHNRAFKEAKDNLIDQTKGNTLFLSVLGVNNGEISGKVLKWFSGLNVIMGTTHAKYQPITRDFLKNEIYRPNILNFFRKSDLFIQDITIEEGVIKTVHNVYNKKKEIIGTKKVDLVEKESTGTNKLFNLSGPIIDSLLNGKVLWIDEMDASLHTFQSQAILSLFHNKETNPNNAQLVFNSHDTNFLNQEIFRRDQIWFIEKEYDENTKLYSLLDYQPRNDASLEKRYLSGAFGAIPYIGNMTETIGLKNGKIKTTSKVSKK